MNYGKLEASLHYLVFKISSSEQVLSPQPLAGARENNVSQSCLAWPGLAWPSYSMLYVYSHMRKSEVPLFGKSICHFSFPSGYIGTPLSATYLSSMCAAVLYF